MILLEPTSLFSDILPESYSTPLYFTQEELQYLKGSPALSKYDFLGVFLHRACYTIIIPLASTKR